MIKRLSPYTVFLFLLLSCGEAWAQATDDIEMADVLRANGKIYVVVAVLTAIFAGLVIYLVRLDRRIGRLEKEKAATK